jgi:hypothetical protein
LALGPTVGADLAPRQVDCPNLCAPIGTALTSCPNNICFCPTVVSYGPACSVCTAQFNATFASDVGSLISSCLSIFPILSTGASVPTIACTQQCDPISRVVNSCSDFSCFCPTIQQYAPACISCWATIDIVETSPYEYLLTECIDPATDTFPTSTPTSSVTSYTTAGLNTVSSHSGGLGSWSGVLEGSLFLWIVIGIWTACVGVFFAPGASIISYI